MLSYDFKYFKTSYFLVVGNASYDMYYIGNTFRSLNLSKGTYIATNKWAHTPVISSTLIHLYCDVNLRMARYADFPTYWLYIWKWHEPLLITWWISILRLPLPCILWVQLCYLRAAVRWRGIQRSQFKKHIIVKTILHCTYSVNDYDHFWCSY